MPSKAHEDPVAQARRLVADGRQRFARDVDEILADIPMGIYRDAILEKFEVYVSMKPLADPVLLQLVKEAYELLSNPDSQVDLRDWLKVAAPFVRE